MKTSKVSTDGGQTNDHETQRSLVQQAIISDPELKSAIEQLEMESGFTPVEGVLIPTK
jgi:hypothetical protein